MPPTGPTKHWYLPAELEPFALLTRTARSQGLIIGVDGATGSGKSTLARHLAAETRAVGARVQVLAVEDHVPGWHGLAEGVRQCAQALRDLEARGSASVASWDWQAMAPGPDTDMTLPPGGVLLVEGCGALAAMAQPFERLDALRVLVQAPQWLRHARITVRDAYRWDVAGWEAQEQTVAGAWLEVPGLGPDLVVHSGTWT